MTDRITRRALIALFPTGLAATADKQKKAKPLPIGGEFVRFADPTTENMVVRLTALTSNSYLPQPPSRFISIKGRFLVFSSDRQGKPMPYQVDLRNGVLRNVAETADLDRESLCLVEKKDILYFKDADSLIEANLSNRKIRTIAREVDAFGVDETGTALYVVRKGKLEQVLANESIPVAENVTPPCMVRPGGRGCLFQRDVSSESREFWYAPPPDSGAEPVRLAGGRVSDPFWSEAGDSVIFLRDLPKGNALISEIHQVQVDKPVENCIAPTSQFASFAPNKDGSVFVGASRSKAQPNVILLLRSAQREMTLCEHRASHPASVTPAFSPDSRRVYFQSDHQGKSAIYSVNIELLVEPTESGVG